MFPVRAMQKLHRDRSARREAVNEPGGLRPENRCCSAVVVAPSLFLHACLGGVFRVWSCVVGTLSLALSNACCECILVYPVGISWCAFFFLPPSQDP